MANRFWVAQPVSGAIVSAASPPQVRLTVSSTTGMTTGDTRTVSGIVGTTEANGTWVITVIDATHIDLQGTTFANLYTSGGTVNGRWDATNTNNWVSSSGGTNYGQTIPGSGDAATLDAASGGGTVTVNATITIQSLTCGAFTGTLDFSANNNNVTLSTNSGFNGSGSGTRTINLGNGTWTLTGTGTMWNLSTTTNLTFNANSSTIVFTATSASPRNMLTGGKTYSTITISANTSLGQFSFTTAPTIGTFNVSAPNAISFPSSATTTITNALTLNGMSLTSLVELYSDTLGTTGTVSSANNGTFTWTTFRDLTFSGGGTFSATNSIDLGRNSGITITAPSAGGSGGGSVYGGLGGVVT